MIKKLLLIAALLTTMTACTRIETGEVGIRVDFDKQVKSGELMPGSWNQTLIGDVITFPVKDVPINLENKNPLTADSSALKDFDVTVIYNINPSCVAEIYSTKSKTFHYLLGNDVLLMYGYLETLVNNASYKAVRKYVALEVADNRPKIEMEIKEQVTKALQDEKLANCMTISQVLVRSALPADDILKAANDYVKSQNDLKIKENEVKLAKLESERMAALANNSEKSIAYIQAQAELNYSEAAKLGKVNTIVVPRDFKGMINVTK